MQDALNRRYQGNYRSYGGLILLVVSLLHVSLYFLWPLVKANASYDKSKSASLIFLNVPVVKKAEKPVELKRNQSDLSISAKPKPSVSQPVFTPGEETVAMPSSPSEQSIQPNSSQQTGQADSQTPATINRDVTGIFKGMKKDFEARDRVSSKAVIPPIAKLGERIAESSLVMREGYKHEVHILGDGRPVSKVITPFGTYCILHRKPGETIGNELATVPVTCGNL